MSITLTGDTLTSGSCSGSRVTLLLACLARVSASELSYKVTERVLHIFFMYGGCIVQWSSSSAHTRGNPGRRDAKPPKSSPEDSQKIAHNRLRN